MAIKGSVTLEDIRIDFNVRPQHGGDVAEVFVQETQPSGTVAEESYECDAAKFMKALAIAVHYEGMPNADEDYSDAESVQRKIRWIP